MSMAVGGGGGRPKSEPNVTPYIDILLVLLIIFMVITPVKPKGFDVRVPTKIKSNVVVPPTTSIVLKVTNRATLLINNDIPASFSNLEDKLKRIFESREDKRLFILGEKQTNYGNVIRAIEIAKSAGVLEFGFMTRMEE